MAIFAVLLLLLTACGKTEEAASGEVIDNSRTAIALTTQEYNGGNIVEIPMIVYDGENPQLASYDGKNQEIERINDDIKNGIQQTYNTFLSNAQDGNIEIKTYPFSNETYLQIVMTYIEYPSYGSDGKMWSYNFNKKENRYITLEEQMESVGLTADALAEKVKAKYTPESDTLSIGTVTPVGFLLRDGDTHFLLEVQINNTESSPWTCFYSYAPQLDELLRLNSVCLFDPSAMDVTDPPLSYLRENSNEENTVAETTEAATTPQQNTSSGTSAPSSNADSSLPDRETWSDPGDGDDVWSDPGDTQDDWSDPGDTQDDWSDPGDYGSDYGDY